ARTCGTTFAQTLRKRGKLAVVAGKRDHDRDNPARPRSHSTYFGEFLSVSTGGCGRISHTRRIAASPISMRFQERVLLTPELGLLRICSPGGSVSGAAK